MGMDRCRSKEDVRQEAERISKWLKSISERLRKAKRPSEKEKIEQEIGYAKTALRDLIVQQRDLIAEWRDRPTWDQIENL